MASAVFTGIVDFSTIIFGPVATSAIVLATDIKDDANMDFRFIVCGVVRSVTGRPGDNHQTKRESDNQQLQLHSEITSFTSSGAVTGSLLILYAAWIRAAVSRPLF